MKLFHLGFCCFRTLFFVFFIVVLQNTFIVCKTSHFFEGVMQKCVIFGQGFAELRKKQMGLCKTAQKKKTDLT